MAFNTNHNASFYPEQCLEQTPCSSLCRDYADWEQLSLIYYPQRSYSDRFAAEQRHLICVCLNESVMPGNISIYPADIMQTFTGESQSDLLLLYLKPTLIQQIGAQVYPGLQLELNSAFSIVDPFIYQLAIGLKTVLETDTAHSKYYGDTIANTLALHLLYRYCSHYTPCSKCNNTLSQQQLQRISDYLSENLHRNISLAELANLVHLSSFHFARTFKQTTGIAPHHYHILRRVERAKQLLVEKRQGLAEIAYTVGFANQGHFSRHFKQIVGVTPKQFLQQA
jgi:AraC family transcriptional regulator